MASVGQELGSRSGGWFWFRASCEMLFKMLAGAGGSSFKLTHVAGGRRAQFLPLWTSHRAAEHPQDVAAGFPK